MDKKIPTTRANYIGIEFEFISLWHEDDIVNVIVAEGLERVCNLAYDASIDMDNGGAADDHGYELRLCVKETDLRKTLKKLSAVFKKCNATVNDTCGLHVHLDMRQRVPIKSLHNLFDKQQEFRSMVPSHRRFNKEYCEKADMYKTIEDFCGDQRSYDGHYDSCNKYQDINAASYKKLKTFEVRIHQGCVNMETVYNWVSYLTHTVDAKPLPKWLVKYVSIAKRACA